MIPPMDRQRLDYIIAALRARDEEVVAQDKLLKEMAVKHDECAAELFDVKADRDRLARELEEAKLDPQEKIMVNMTLDGREQKIAVLRDLLARVVQKVDEIIKMNRDHTHGGECLTIGLMLVGLRAIAAQSPGSQAGEKNA